VAGDDISPAVPIIQDASSSLESYSAVDLDVAVAAVKNAYKKQLKIIAEDSVLTKYGYSTMEDFLKAGKEQLGELLFDEIIKELSAVELKCDFLCAGFDTEKKPHIFSIGEYGHVHYYDKPGFWAIGSGEHGALSALYSFPYDVRNDIATCMCHVLTAKFVAETAYGVGKKSFSVILRPDTLVSGLSAAVSDEFKAEWNKIPRWPEHMLESVREDMVKNLEQMNKDFAKKKQGGQK
jgi:ATP-dependent protease HslVU (ClpYQ) peptidase subunit